MQPQGGWGQPPGWGPPQGAPPGFGPPGYRAPSAVPTVARVPLFPGERVLYFLKPNQGATRLVYFAAGILLMPILLGFYLIYVGIAFEEKQEHYYVITTQRVFTVNAKGGVLTTVPNAGITNLTHRMGNGTNTLSVSAGNTFIQFRRQEGHDMARVKEMLSLLKNPAYLAQAPDVPFEP